MATGETPDDRLPVDDRSPCDLLASASAEPEVIRNQLPEALRERYTRDIAEAVDEGDPVILAETQMMWDLLAVALAHRARALASVPEEHRPQVEELWLGAAADTFSLLMEPGWSDGRSTGNRSSGPFEGR